MSDDADEREREEAEALSRALDARGAGSASGSESGSGSADEGVRDALEAAALLRYGGGEGELRAERADAVLERLMPRVDGLAHGTAKPSRAPRRVLRFVPAGMAVFAAAAGAWLVLSNDLAPHAASVSSAPVASAPLGEPPSAGGAPSSLPAPSQRLLAMQAALAGEGPARDPVAFEAEMRAYRERLLHSLERAYPPQLGMLEPAGAR